MYAKTHTTRLRRLRVFCHRSSIHTKYVLPFRPKSNLLTTLHIDCLGTAICQVHVRAVREAYRLNLGRSKAPVGR